MTTGAGSAPGATGGSAAVEASGRLGQFHRTLHAWQPFAAAVLGRAVGLGALAGLLAAQIALALEPERGIPAALGAGARAALVTWLVVTLVEVAVDMVRGGPAAAEPAAEPPTETQPGGLDARRMPGLDAGSRVAPGASRVSALQITAGAAALIAAALQRAPSRLVLNLSGYLLLAIPLAWAVRRRAGPAAASKASLALAVVALVSTHVDLPRDTAFDISQARADSPFRWSTGWPGERWILRQEIQLARPAPARPVVLLIPLAARYEGPARVFASLNGQDLGLLRGAERGFLQVEVPAELVAGQAHLTLDLRQSPVDPRLRLVAQRWAAGATLGAAASSFHDAEQWRPGTFNDLAGRPQPGLYVLEFRGLA